MLWLPNLELKSNTNVFNDLDYRKVGTDRRAVRSGVAREFFWRHKPDGAPSVSSKVPPSGTTEGGHALPQNKWL